MPLGAGISTTTQSSVGFTLSFICGSPKKEGTQEFYSFIHSSRFSTDGELTPPHQTQVFVGIKHSSSATSQRCHSWGTALAGPRRTCAPKEIPSARDLVPLWGFWIHPSSGGDFPGRKAARCRLLNVATTRSPALCLCVWSSLSGCTYLPFLKTRGAEDIYAPLYSWPSPCCAGAQMGCVGRCRLKELLCLFEGCF